MVVLPLLFLLGSQFLCGRGELYSSAITMLTEAALKWEGPLPCDKYDCKCAFQHQRGCCCAADPMFKLEEEAFGRIFHLWYDVMSLKYKVKRITDHNQIAFKATMDPNNSKSGFRSTVRCFGPFVTNVPIPYAIVSLNDANAYNPALGVFAAPWAGVFVFSFTVYSYVSEEDSLSYQVQLMKNGEVAVSVWENNREDLEDNGNQVVVLELVRGDMVYVELVAGKKLCRDLQHNIFTGYILYPNAAAAGEEEHDGH
ncbi:cerebellin 18 [Clinocottus analis]|uniref:cerebellin 18 n=1 Tax=Clinocottus analis TaxID=304258 RepID=UPI0035BF198E